MLDIQYIGREWELLILCERIIKNDIEKYKNTVLELQELHTNIEIGKNQIWDLNQFFEENKQKLTEVLEIIRVFTCMSYDETLKCFFESKRNLDQSIIIEGKHGLKNLQTSTFKEYTRLEEGKKAFDNYGLEVFLRVLKYWLFYAESVSWAGWNTEKVKKGIISDVSKAMN